MIVDERLDALDIQVAIAQTFGGKQRSGGSYLRWRHNERIQEASIL